MSEYTQGVCNDCAAILKDGQPMTVEEILSGLRQRDEALEREQALAAHAERLKGLGSLIAKADSNVEFDEFVDRCEKWDAAVKESPTTSLTELKAHAAADHIDKWSQTIIRLAEDLAAKHSADPNYPPVGLQFIRELCCDMDADADRLRRQAEENAHG